MADHRGGEKHGCSGLEHFTLSVGIILAISVLVSFSGRSIAAPSGESMYKKKCGFCHADGGNKMVPSKPVKGSKKLETKEIFKTFLSKKNGTMPAFTDIANNDEALTALHTYCKSLK